MIWLKNANCPGGTLDWYGAMDFVAGINSGGNDCGDISQAGDNQTDWRLPNIRELHSLVNFAYCRPAISNAAGTAKGSGSDPFLNLQTSLPYWSSTTDADGAGYAWGVAFSDGTVNNIGSLKTNFNYVTAVRGGN